MILLLPPSETKQRPELSHAADSVPALAPTFAEELPQLAHPELLGARRTMAAAVERTARSRTGAEALGVPVSAPHLVERMAQLGAEPVGAPLQVYTGVLFEQLGSEVRPGGDRRVLIQSALLGLVDAARDRIPAYRVSAHSRISRLGAAGPWWRRHQLPLGSRIAEEAADSPSPFVIDARSGAYRSMMPIPPRPGMRVLEVAPVQERGGRRRVVSHDAKRYRGWVARVLLEHAAPIPDERALVTVLDQAFDGSLGIEIAGDRLVIVDRAD